MRKLLLLTALTLSSSAFAQMCQVNMVDLRGRLLDTFRAYDMGDACKEGMKECRKQIRLRGLLNRADCVRVGQTPVPNPYPNPYPYPGQTCRGYVDDVNSVRYWQRDYYTQPGSIFASYDVVPATLGCKRAILDEHRKQYYYDTVSSPARYLVTNTGGGYPQPQTVTCTGDVDDLPSVRRLNRQFYTEPYYEFAAYNVNPQVQACKKAVLDEHRRMYSYDRTRDPSRRITVTIQL